MLASSGERVPLSDERLDVAIDGQEASTTLVQTYRNGSNARIEGNYHLKPGSGSHVDGFAYWNGEQKIVGEVFELPGWIPREDLYDLYARAWAFIYPSRFEGFGLPVLEALAAGIPTACSDIEPVTGIAADAAIKFDPADPSAIAAAMDRITTDASLRAHLAEAGPLRAAQFAWRKTADLTLAALKDGLD